MIKCDRGSVSIEGHKSVIKAELATLIHCLRYDDVLTEDEIRNCVENGLKSDEELNKNLDSIEQDVLNKLTKILEILHSEE